jgi:pimeloyl-ACP methyl ester carboxylesterase
VISGRPALLPLWMIMGRWAPQAHEKPRSPHDHREKFGGRRVAAAAIGVGALLAGCTTSSSHASNPTSPASASAPASTAASSEPATSQPAVSTAPAATSPASSEAAVSPSTAGPPVPTQLPHIDPATLQVFYAQHLAWHGCANGFQCASLKVPVDYANPGGATIELAVVRDPTSAKHKLGSVVLNPGGPGASGIGYAEGEGQTIKQALGGAFDVVSFDPRGVGASAPIRCLTSKQLDQWVAFEADPNSPASVAQQDQLAKQFAAGCEAHSPALLPHVSTVDTARDLDVLRAALGDAKLTYIGASYGTFLGAIYAQLFPANIRALVLDGALDPAASSAELDHVQARGFEVALKSYIATCVKSTSCPLGTSPAAAEPKLDAWLAGLQAKPLPGAGGRVLTAALAVGGVAAALYSPNSWSYLSSSLHAAFGGNPSGLLALSDDLDGRQSDGSYNNLIESNMAINCVDRPGLGPTMAAYAKQAAGGAADGPTFGEYVDWGNVACADWPVAPELAPGPVNPVGAPPILVIGTLRDPATPYQWAQSLAKEVNGPLLTYNGDGHTAFLRSTCVDAVVKAYLTTLATPAAGKTCN